MQDSNCCLTSFFLLHTCIYISINTPYMHTGLLLYSVSAYSIYIYVITLHLYSFFSNFFFLLHTCIQYLHVHKHSISTYSTSYLHTEFTYMYRHSISVLFFLTSFFLYSIPAYSIYICINTPYMHTGFSSLLHISIHYLHIYRHSLLNIWVQYLHI